MADVCTYVQGHTSLVCVYIYLRFDTGPSHPLTSALHRVRELNLRACVKNNQLSPSIAPLSLSLSLSLSRLLSLERERKKKEKKNCVILISTKVYRDTGTEKKGFEQQTVQRRDKRITYCYNSQLLNGFFPIRPTPSTCCPSSSSRRRRRRRPSSFYPPTWLDSLLAASPSLLRYNHVMKIIRTIGPCNPLSLSLSLSLFLSLCPILSIYPRAFLLTLFALFLL